MGGAPGVDQDELAVEDRRLRGQLGEGLDHARQTVGVFGTVARIQPHPATVLDDLEAKAIPLGLVQPVIALGRTDGCRGGKGTDKGKARRHYRTPVFIGMTLFWGSRIRAICAANASNACRFSAAY